MSWQAYVDTNLVGTGKLTQAAIHGHNGGLWATSAGFSINANEMVALTKAFSDASGIRANGLHIGGVKYIALKADDRSVYGKKGAGGVVCVKTKQAILIGVYDEPIQPGEATKVVESLADYLISVNYTENLKNKILFGMSSEISLSDSDQDWDTLEELDIICPFCDQSLVGVHSAFEHSVLDHDFDFIKAKEQLKLDEYGWFKLVNFTRNSLKSNPSFNMNDLLGDQTWLDDDTWLSPVLQDDPLLYALEELDLGSNQSNDPQILSALEQELIDAKERALIAEKKLQGVTEAFHVYQTMVTNTFLKEDKESFQENVTLSDEEEKDGYFTSYGELDIHEVMLKDKVRTCAYRDAIYDNKEYFKDKVVLDIGCGTGILSLFAAKAGAAQVFAVDNSTIIKRAAEIAKLNHLDNVITFIPGKIEEITLPCDKVDIIISEWMGYFLLYEGMLNSVLFARDKWLSPDGLMAPSHVSLKITGFSDSEYINDRLHYWKDVYGFNMSPMRSFVLQDAQVDWFNASSCISKPATIKTFVTATARPEELNFSSDFEIIPSSDGYLHGILGWFDTEFNCDAHDWKPISFSTSPFDTDTHWKQTLFVFSDPLPLKKDECKTGRISVQQMERDLEIKIRIDDSEFRFEVK